MEESIVERVLILIKDYGLTHAEFADKIDVQRSSMSHLVSGRNKPSLDFIQKVLNNFSDINPTWLIMGTGPMKQLDLFDIKGDVAPIEPITAEKIRIEPAVAAQEKTKLAIQEPEYPIVPTDNKKVIYAQSAPTTEVVAELPSVQEPVHQAAVIAPHANPPAPALVTAPVVAQESHIHIPKANSVALEGEKSVQNDKKVVKIVFFYSDNTFETFNPH